MRVADGSGVSVTAVPEASGQTITTVACLDAPRISIYAGRDPITGPAITALRYKKKSRRLNKIK